MTETTWLIDRATGDLVVEGLTTEEAAALVADLLPSAQMVNCARPLISSPLAQPETVEGVTLQVARIYHGSLVEGPGRRSVVQLQGCPIRCPGCYVPETHDPAGGITMSVADVLSRVLDPIGAPRDGVTVLGGEPFFQPVGLLALLQELKAQDLHTVVYTGYRLEALARRPEPEVRAALELTDLLIDGPFVAALSDGAGEWRGSRNQRVIESPDKRPQTNEVGGTPSPGSPPS
ncbi:MAG TPA: 4Fe-4S single cluster domain-containing protein [Thermomicrobiaceae bacterium]|nr:4Fe-4S single cluster domain-containing protein [Thermomicrobiaceae bacterium]